MAAEGVEVQATKRLAFSALGVGSTLKGRHISGTVKRLWPISNVSSHSISGDKWGCASRILKMVLEDFTVASATELNVACYDAWAEKLCDLVSTGDLLHICGTGAVVAENAAKSLPSDHDGRLIIAEASVLDSLQPDTQQGGGVGEGYTQMAAFQPVSQSAGFDSQPPAPLPTGSAGAGGNRRPAPEVSISVRVQKALPSTSASMYKRKQAFGPVRKVTSASLHQASSPPRPLAAPLRRTKTDGTVHQLHRSRTAPASSSAAHTAPSPPTSPGALSSHSAEAAGSPLPSASPAGSPGGQYGDLVRRLIGAAPDSHRKRYRRSSGKLDFLRLACSRSKMPRRGSSASDGSGSGSGSDDCSEQEHSDGGRGAALASPEEHSDGYSSEASLTVQEMLRSLPQGSSAAPTGPAWIMASQMQSMVDDDHSLVLPRSAAAGAMAQPAAQHSQAPASETPLQSMNAQVCNSASPMARDDLQSAAASAVFDASTVLGEPRAQFDYASDSPPQRQSLDDSPPPRHALDESITPSLSSVDHTPATAPAPPRVALRGPVGALQLEVAPPQASSGATAPQQPRRVSFGSSGGTSRASFVRNLSSAGLSAGSRPVVRDSTPSASPAVGSADSASGAASSATPAAEREEVQGDAAGAEAPFENRSTAAPPLQPDAGAASAAAASAGSAPDTGSEAAATEPKWNELAARASAGAARGGGGKYTYRPLDSLPVQQRVNLYGVVLDCSLPTATKGSDFKSKLVLLDESRSNITQAAVVHSFLKQDKHLIPHQAGDVLRLHRAKIVNFNGQEQIQLNNPERVAGGRPSGMIFRQNGSYSATSNNFTLTAADIARIRALMEWGEALLRSDILYSSQYSIDMKHTVAAPGQGGSQLDGYKDCLVCVAAIFVNGTRLAGGLAPEDCPAGASVQFLVWDGTGPGGACATYMPEDVEMTALYPSDAGGRNLGALVYVDITPQAAVVSSIGIESGNWIRMRNLSPFLLKQGCFPGGVAIPEPDAANHAVLYGLRLHQGGVIKVPAFCKDVLSKLNSYKSLASEAVQEEIRQLQFGIHPKFSISSGNELAPVTSIADAVKCKYAPSKYRVQGVIVGHWPASVVDCVTVQPDGTAQYSFVLRLARNARDPAHMDIHIFGAPAAELMSPVAPCNLQENEHAMNVLQRMWEFMYSLPVDAIVLAQQAKGTHDEQIAFSLLQGQLNYVGHTA